MKIRTGSSDYAYQVLADLRKLSAEEVLSLHGIRVNEDKTVYDEAYDKTFVDIEDWIAFSEDDVDSQDEKFGYDDNDFI